MILMKSKTNNETCHGKNATAVNVSVLGAILGISGIGHGFFEVLQGNTPTNGLLIHAIGEANRIWAYGNEPAFTLIPSFLITGFAAMLVSLAAIIWSIGFIHKKTGPLVFLLIFILLTLVGGGIGHVIFFTLGWAVSTRINKPLNWWKKVLPEDVRLGLSKQWHTFLNISAFLILYALAVAIFGFVPGVKNPDLITVVMLSSLGMGLVVYILAVIAGFAHDIVRQEV